MKKAVYTEVVGMESSKLNSVSSKRDMGLHKALFSMKSLLSHKGRCISEVYLGCHIFNTAIMIGRSSGVLSLIRSLALYSEQVWRCAWVRYFQGNCTFVALCMFVAPLHALRIFSFGNMGVSQNRQWSRSLDLSQRREMDRSD